MRMNYRSMTACVLAGWTLPAAGAAWLARSGGEARGLAAACAGAAIVLAVALASGALTVRAGARSASRAALTFVAGSLGRVVVAAGLAASAWGIWDLPVRTLLLSLLVCYAGAWGAECLWVLRALRLLPGRGTGGSPLQVCGPETHGRDAHAADGQDGRATPECSPCS